MFTGAANEPLAFDSWAVNTLPAAKTPIVVNGTLMAPPAQYEAGETVLVAMLFGVFTTTVTVRVTEQPLLVATTVYIPALAAAALGTVGFWATDVKPFGPVQA